MATRTPTTSGMNTRMHLPGLEAAREILGLTFDEVAWAVQVDSSSLYRWRMGDTIPTNAALERLRRLEDLAVQVGEALDRDQIPAWLDAPASIFEGKSALEMIQEGRTETVLGALLSHRHALRTLEAVQQGRSGFNDLMARNDLSLQTKAALALLDQPIEDLVQEMRT